ncbi:DUF3833 domain-containing protein [Glaciimonas immobilis]|uniref:DUF3833 domain-containing protein n=1 Tax=Glaciimonas immobilis TaxID=728004 RepID=A0A840RUT4_9BURK|nr:DUF3833 domain-containing protein [Glaciimonas immobilis]KAF3997327.1 DUF3833 domain-containing protein [Glaciimonas immobilis]MBB5202367.1 hypothetical protein [Glaciimonas immobilis]
MKIFLKILVVSLLVLLNGCSTTSEGTQYADQKPTLTLSEYFNGTLDAWGMFQDRSGKVVKRFTVVIQCKWEGDTGTLDEDFTYSDGTKQRRIWTLKKVAANKFIGTASDIVGEAIGITDGNTLHWKYVLALPVDGHVINVSMDDLMVRMDQRVMLNHTVMSKLGFKLGDISLSFSKRP